jgi:DNA-binding MarR family transcriptional regulator
MRKTISPHDLPPLLLDGVDPLSARVLQALRKTIHVHRQLMVKTLAERGTHPGEAVCLRVLAQHDGMSQRDLANMLYLSRPRVTTMLQALEKAGTVVRRPDETDQRLTRVYLTAQGHRLEEDLRSLMVEFINRTIGTMTVGDRTDLERLLEELAANTSRALLADDSRALPADEGEPLR